MSKWDQRFLELANHVRGWSLDPSTKVGAVVVGAGDKRSLAVGYNGFPPGIADDERLNDRDVKYRLIVHAEINAIRNARFPVAGATLYTTKFPCDSCAKEIVSAGIQRVVSPEPDWDCQRWGEPATFARRVFDEAGIEVSFLTRQDVIETAA